MNFLFCSSFKLFVLFHVSFNLDEEGYKKKILEIAMLSGSCFMFMFSQVNIFISSEGIGAWWNSAGDRLLERALGLHLPLTITVTVLCPSLHV